MAIASMLLLVLFALCALAAILLVFRAKLAAAATEAALLHTQVIKLDADIAVARAVGETWRARAESEREARAGAEAAASRVSGLEAELARLRDELVTICSVAGQFSRQLHRPRRVSTQQPRPRRSSDDPQQTVRQWLGRPPRVLQHPTKT
jgi:hypothetical protein